MSTVERLTPLHCIGESHCLRLRDRVFRTDGADPLHARVRFLPDFSAASALRDGALDPALAAALVASEVCVARALDDGGEELEPAHKPTTFDGRVRAAREAALAGQPLVAPALMLFAGDKDLISLAQTLHDEGDFELPADPGYGLDRTRTRIHFAAVECFVLRSLTPFFEVLALLRDAGFARTVVHGLLPRSAERERASRWYGGALVDPSLCSKLAVAMNRLIERRCRALGLGFVDVWDPLAKGGYLDPAFDLDGIHANELANPITFEHAARELQTLTRAAVNPAQYELLAELSPERWSGASPPAEGALLVAVPATLDVSPKNGSNRVDAVLCERATQAALDRGADCDTGLILATAVDLAPGAKLESPFDAVDVSGPRRAIFVVEGALTARVHGADPHGSSPVLITAGHALVWEAGDRCVEIAATQPGTVTVDLRLLPRLPGEACEVLWDSGTGLARRSVPRRAVFGCRPGADQPLARNRGTHDRGRAASERSSERNLVELPAQREPATAPTAVR